MPTRRAALAIVLFWLFCQAWFVRREYLPHWLATDEAPEFTVDLADEAAPRYSSWAIYREGRRLGTLTSRLTFLPAQNAFESESRFQKLELSATVPFVGRFKITAPSVVSVAVVSRDGELRSLKTDASFRIELEGAEGKPSPIPEIAFKSSLSGTVRDGLFSGESEFQSDQLGGVKAAVEPFAVVKGSAFNPMQPQDRIAGLKPGRSWRLSRIDPVSDTFTRASLQTVGSLARQNGSGAPDLRSLVGSKAAEVLIAQVSAEPQPLDWKGQTELCHVIEYRGEGPAGRTWVRASDGKVLQQEARGQGETLMLIRDN